MNIQYFEKKFKIELKECVIYFSIIDSMANYLNTFSKVDSSWKNDEINSQLQYISGILRVEHEQFEGMAEIYPPTDKVFNAFTRFNLEDCRVIIIGQDPYHGPGQAMGLSFSVPDGVRIPPSLRNIFKEMILDTKFDGDKSRQNDVVLPESGDLTHLAEQGVLLLNAALTVRQAKANSHYGIWREFTRMLFLRLIEKSEGLVIMLWGNDAKQMISKVSDEVLSKHLILKATHPSPLSANRGGWFGTRHFSKANQYLVSRGKTPINWI